MFSPGLLSYNDLRGVEFLQGGLGGVGGGAGGQEGMLDTNMDLGFGMGWDGGLGQHDFSDGAGGLDLFDGFFFGGQQGSGGVGGGVGGGL